MTTVNVAIFLSWRKNYLLSSAVHELLPENLSTSRLLSAKQINIPYKLCKDENDLSDTRLPFAMSQRFLRHVPIHYSLRWHTFDSELSSVCTSLNKNPKMIRSACSWNFGRKTSDTECKECMVASNSTRQVGAARKSHAKQESYFSSTQFGFQVFTVVWYHAVANLGSLYVDHLVHKSQDPEQTAIVTLEDNFGTPASTYL